CGLSASPTRWFRFPRRIVDTQHCWSVLLTRVRTSSQRSSSQGVMVLFPTPPGELSSAKISYPSGRRNGDAARSPTFHRFQPSSTRDPRHLRKSPHHPLFVPPDGPDLVRPDEARNLAAA